MWVTRCRYTGTPHLEGAAVKLFAYNEESARLVTSGVSGADGIVVLDDVVPNSAGASPHSAALRLPVLTPVAA